jgi:hypothetical protein
MAASINRRDILVTGRITRFFINMKSHIAVSSSLLLALLFIIIFLVPLASGELQKPFFSICFTLIFVLSAFSITLFQERIALFAVAVILIEWISLILNLPVIYSLSFPVKFLFFLVVLMILIVQIAKAKTVTLVVLLQSINVYLLLGLTFSVMVALLESIYPDSFNFQYGGEFLNKAGTFRSDFIYFTFVSFTSTGYGDFLPITPAAKSLAIMISITGQLYLAIIIAMLVGKYSSKV